MNHADTNRLTAMFFTRHQPERTATAARFMRQQSGQLGVSQIVMLEAENVFRRNAGTTFPGELDEMRGAGFYRDPMDWPLVQRDTQALLSRYAHKATLGTFDMAVIAAARLGGATRILSFDETLKAVAVAEGLEVFPPLSEEGRQILVSLRS